MTYPGRSSPARTPAAVAVVDRRMQLLLRSVAELLAGHTDRLRRSLGTQPGEAAGCNSGRKHTSHSTINIVARVLCLGRLAVSLEENIQPIQQSTSTTLVQVDLVISLKSVYFKYLT